MERTCVIVKPDGVGKKVVGEVVRRLESEPLRLIGMKMIRPVKSQIESFYEVHRGKPFYEPLVRFMLSGPIVVTAWEGEDAITRVRTIIGATNSKEAAPDTLRQMFGTDNRRNLVHASDSKENGVREVSFYFAPNELFAYDSDEWKKW